MASEYIVLAIGAVAAGAFVFRDAIFGGSPKAPPMAINSKAAVLGGGDPRDFVARMTAGVSVFFNDHVGHTMFITFYFTEETPGHLLRLSDRHRRRVCHPHRKGGKVTLWPRITCLRS